MLDDRVLKWILFLLLPGISLRDPKTATCTKHGVHRLRFGQSLATSSDFRGRESCPLGPQTIRTVGFFDLTSHHTRRVHLNCVEVMLPWACSNVGIAFSFPWRLIIPLAQIHRCIEDQREMNGYTLVLRVNYLRILVVASRTAVGMERVVDRSVPPAARLRSTDLTILATHSDGSGDLRYLHVYTVQSDPSHSLGTGSILSHSLDYLTCVHCLQSLSLRPFKNLYIMLYAYSSETYSLSFNSTQEVTLLYTTGHHGHRTISCFTQAKFFFAIQYERLLPTRHTEPKGLQSVSLGDWLCQKCHLS
ncbi:hypothetical protein GGI35DRAFT_206921 [Trichoderma velutinum]